MKELKYLYAEDEQGNSIHINEAIKGGVYYNLTRGKDGQKIPMIVRDGGYRTKHFAIQPQYQIENPTTFHNQYIHNLWKKRIKEQFDKSEHFYIKLYVFKWDEKRLCLQTFDLKERFDTCEEEKGYKGYMDDKEYIGDLKLTNSKHPEREPVFIEVFYTHECSKEKKVSGIKIIEVKVESDEDVELLYEETCSPELKHNILIRNTMNPYMVKDISNTRFYGFSREFKLLIGRFSVIKEDSGGIVGKYSELDDFWQEAELTHDKNSLMDITLPADIVAKQPGEFMKAFYATALKHQIPVVYCNICYNSIYYSTVFNKRCPVLQNRAESCDSYRFRTIDINRFCKILPCKQTDIWINQELLSKLPIKVRHP